MPMPHVHDRGGWPDAGPINKEEHDYSLWEKQTDALLMLLVSPTKKVLRVDELRRAIESFAPDAYEKMKYYERWITAIELLRSCLGKEFLVMSRPRIVSRST
jgi:nitrile hydratase subunit beta